MEIITAGDGTAHVSSSDDGAVYAGIVGADCYVTSVGERLSCTMQGANTALVGTGVGFMFGRAFRITIPEEVTIQSGTQSQRRNDIICAHFATSSDGHESGELVVLKGTPTSGAEAEDPEIPSGDILEGSTEAYMPLWRIPLDGINVGEPESMFNVMLSMAELRDSVSHDDWQGAGDFRWCRFGNMVCVQVYNASLSAMVTTQLGSLPSEARPTATLVSPRAAVGVVITDGVVGYLYVNVDGSVSAWAPSAGSYTGQVCFPSAS